MFGDGIEGGEVSQAQWGGLITNLRAAFYNISSSHLPTMIPHTSRSTPTKWIAFRHRLLTGADGLAFQFPLAVGPGLDSFFRAAFLFFKEIRFFYISHSAFWPLSFFVEYLSSRLSFQLDLVFFSRWFHTFLFFSFFSGQNCIAFIFRLIFTANSKTADNGIPFHLLHCYRVLRIWPSGYL